MQDIDALNSAATQNSLERWQTTVMARKCSRIAQNIDIMKSKAIYVPCTEELLSNASGTESCAEFVEIATDFFPSSSLKEIPSLVLRESLTFSSRNAENECLTASGKSGSLKDRMEHPQRIAFPCSIRPLAIPNSRHWEMPCETFYFIQEGLEQFNLFSAQF